MEDEVEADAEVFVELGGLAECDVGFEVDEMVTAEVEVSVGGLEDWNVDAEAEDEVDTEAEVEVGGKVEVEFWGEVLTEESEGAKDPVLVY